MNKEFFMLCETDTHNVVSIGFVMNHCLIGIENLVNHCEKEELENYIKALNYYKRILKFVKEIACEKQDRHEPLVESWEDEARELLKEIGEL